MAFREALTLKGDIEWRKFQESNNKLMWITLNQESGSGKLLTILSSSVGTLTTFKTLTN